MSSILVFLERKPFGGAERATSLILQLLANEGFNLTVVAGSKNIESLKNVKWVYSPLLDVPSKLHLWLTLLRPMINQFGELIKKSDVVYIPRLAYPIIPLAKKYGKKIVVHLHDYQPMSYCAAAFPSSLKKYDIDLLSDVKASLQHELLENENVWRAIFCSLVTPLNKLCGIWLSEADEIICVSKKQREIIGSAMPELMNRLRVIYNPLPKQPLVEKDLSNQPSMLYLGGDSYTKGFHMFLKVSCEILKRNHNVKFQLTRNLKNARNKAVIETLNKRFDGAYRLLGHLKYKDVLRLHSTNHAILFPSVWEEPLPYAVVESMLSGTLPIASRVGGVPEIVQGTYAEKMMFTPGDVEESVRRIEEVLSLSEESLIDIGASLRESILKKFNVNMIRDQLLDIFSESS